MATYYIRKTGSNAAAGTSAGTAWQTIGKALASGSSVVAGDTVYIGAGMYRESVTVAVSGSSGSGQINVLADVDGSQTGDGGDVVWSAYTTNDLTAPATAACLLNGQTYLKFKGLTMIGGDGSGGNQGGCFDSGPSGNDHLTFEDCTLLQQAQAHALSLYAAAVNTAITIDRCRFWSMGHGRRAIHIYFLATAAGYDCGLIIRNSLFVLGGDVTGVTLNQSGGAGTGYPGGGSIRNCTFVGGVYGIRIETANFRTAAPLTVKNCWLMSHQGSDLNANTSGQITEDYNLLQGQTARSNVTAGSNSRAGNTTAPLINVGQEIYHGWRTRPFATPLVTLKGGAIDVVSPHLGFGSDGSAPATDGLGRIRPAGGSSTSPGLGYSERHDTATQETTTVDASGSGVVIVGPGDHDLKVPVDASATTISIKGRYDTTHAATNKPQVLLLANPKLGISAQTLTMTSAADTWETLTTSSFTPTAKGVVTLRLVSRSAAGGGKAFFDTVT